MLAWWVWDMANLSSPVLRTHDMDVAARRARDMALAGFSAVLEDPQRNQVHWEDGKFCPCEEWDEVAPALLGWQPESRRRLRLVWEHEGGQAGAATLATTSRPPPPSVA